MSVAFDSIFGQHPNLKMQQGLCDESSKLSGSSPESIGRRTIRNDMCSLADHAAISNAASALRRAEMIGGSVTMDKAVLLAQLRSLLATVATKRIREDSAPDRRAIGKGARQVLTQAAARSSAVF